MSKKLNLFAVLVLALMVMFTVSCEGPAGEDGLAGTAGTDGTDGTDGASGFPAGGTVGQVVTNTGSGAGGWADAAGGGKVLQGVYAAFHGIASTTSTSFADTGHHTKAITSTALNSSFLVTLAYNPQVLHGTSPECDGQLTLRSSVDSYASNLSWGRNFDRGSYNEFNTYVQCLHSPSQASGTTITYKSYFNSPSGSTFKLSDYWTNAGLGAAPSTIIIMEIGA